MTSHQGDGLAFSPSFASFEDKEIRRGFIRKVFSLVAVQLTITIAFVLVTTLVDSIREYLTGVENFDVVVGVLVVCAVLYIMTAIIVYCVPTLSKRYPANLILLLILTISCALMVSILGSAVGSEPVMIALGITFLCCTGIFVFSFNTRYNLSSWQGALFCLFLVIVFTAAMIPAPFSSFEGKILAGLVALVFMFILIVDIHRIMGKSSENALSPEEYVLAALQIYSDVILFFLIILLIVVLIAAEGKGGDGGGDCGNCGGACGNCGGECGGCHCCDCGGCGSCGGGLYDTPGSNSNGCCFCCCVRGGQVSRRSSTQEGASTVHVQQPSKISEK